MDEISESPSLTPSPSRSTPSSMFTISLPNIPQTLLPTSSPITTLPTEQLHSKQRIAPYTAASPLPKIGGHSLPTLNSMSMLAVQQSSMSNVLLGSTPTLHTQKLPSLRMNLFFPMEIPQMLPTSKTDKRLAEESNYLTPRRTRQSSAQRWQFLCV